MVFKELIFKQFLYLEGVVVFKELIFKFLYMEGVVVQKKTDF